MNGQWRTRALPPRSRAHLSPWATLGLCRCPRDRRRRCGGAALPRLLRLSGARALHLARALWHRFSVLLRRLVARQARQDAGDAEVKVAYVKVVELQRRAVPHFHAV